MIAEKEYLKRMEIELGEWKEVYGDQFPSFLNHVLVARLLKAEGEIEYFRRRLSIKEFVKS